MLFVDGFFMFVGMSCYISLTEVREGFLQYLPLGALVGFILVLELGVVAGAWALAPDVGTYLALPTINLKASNTEAIGSVLYTHYVYYFQAAGMILLVAMIGAIVLTHRTRTGVRKQNIGDQIARHPSDTLEIKKVSSGSGI